MFCKLIITIHLVGLCSVLKRQPWQSASICPRKYFMMKQLRIAKKSTSQSEGCWRQKIIFPKKSVFKANVYYFKECDRGPKNKRGFKANFGQWKLGFWPVIWPIRNLDSTLQATDAGRPDRFPSLTQLSRSCNPLFENPCHTGQYSCNFVVKSGRFDSMITSELSAAC